MSPDSTGSTVAVFSSHQNPSLVREPLPPATNSYVSFGTFADLYTPRPQAPESDMTFDSSVEEGGGE
ncbi:hypothetical protein FRC12_019507 [Ceratobasidium sp. 428]|nr:hypothetical protein FRC12_019507 [Ceratobasidium sp. 428]